MQSRNHLNSRGCLPSYVSFVSVKQSKDIQATPSLKLKTKSYFVASQDKDLRMRVGSVPGTPIIYLNKVTLILEPPSQDSRDFSKEVIQEQS
jgi:hypothetical protein